MATKKRKPARKSASRAKATRHAPAKKAAKRAPARRAATRKAAPKKGGRFASISPALTANDIERSVAFYTDVLGFRVQERWEEGGKLLGVLMSAGDVVVMMSQDDWKKGRDRKKGEGVRMYLSTSQDVDVLAEELRSRGATIDAEPQSDDWARHFALSDPDGFKISVYNQGQAGKR